MINGRKLYIKKLDGYGRETAEEWRIDGENELYGDKIYNFNLMNARFRIYYEPLGENIRLNTYKQVTVKNEFAIPFSQQQQIVNNMSLGRNMQAMANRTGVETRTICRKVKQF